MPDTPVLASADLTAAHRRRRRREGLTAIGLVAPAVVLLFVLLLGPTSTVIFLSSTDWQFGAGTLNVIGLGNYQELLGDRVFWQSLRNTLLYVAITVPVSVLLGLGIALLVEARSSGQAFYRTVYFLPVTATLIAMAIV